MLGTGSSIKNVTEIDKNPCPHKALIPEETDLKSKHGDFRNEGNKTRQYIKRVVEDSRARSTLVMYK